MGRFANRPYMEIYGRGYGFGMDGFETRPYGESNT
jgi:hypothetical protein